MYDADIRRTLRDLLDREHANEPDTRIFEELGLRQGEVRVDLAVVNGELKGYEIKSQADTLRRLPTQVRIYSQVLDFATIVLEENHREDALTIIPEWWEVLVATRCSNEIRLERTRAGSRNERLNKRALAELLWHAEALDLLRAYDAHRGLSRQPRSYAWDRIAEVCELAVIREAVRRQLKGREAHRPAR